MISARKLAANRRNALRSCGPKSPAGKTASSKNAATHGIFCRIPVLPALGEVPADWAAHLAGVIQCLAPVGRVELDLATRYALLGWRQARAMRYEAAAALVGLQPVATLLAAQVPDPDGPLADRRTDDRIADLQTEAAIVRRAAEAAPRAIALLTGPADSMGDEPVEPAVIELLSRHLCEAAGLPPGPAVRKHLERFWAGPAGTRTGTEPGWELTGWTTETVRAAVAFLAAEGGLPPDRLAALTAEALAGNVKFWEAKAVAAEAAVGRAVGARQAAAVAAAMTAVERGVAELGLALRYERCLTAEQESVLRQLGMLRALRAARSRSGSRE
jgi:hypothetical protein